MVPISFDGDYEDFLPSLNVKFDLTDDLVARFSASKVMTRPTLSDLSPAQTILSNPGNETINRGNPDLDPFRAKQFEVGLEWYFADLSVLSGAAFYKDIESFRRRCDHAATGRSGGVQVTQPENGEGAKVKGLEFGYQQVFDNLPAPFDGFGVQANYTYVESDASYTNVVSGASFGLQGLSRNSVQPGHVLRKGPHPGATRLHLPRQVPAGGERTQRRSGISSMTTVSSTPASASR